MIKSRGRGVLDRPVKPDDDGSLWSERTLLSVVPANAGTHNHRSLLEQKALATVPKLEAAAFGSRRSPGRHRDLHSRDLSARNDGLFAV